MLVQIAVMGQYWENYAMHDWDGIGEYPQNWKSKGWSSSQVVCNVKLSDLFDVVTDLRARLDDFGWSNPASSFDVHDVLVLPNRLAKGEFIEWKYKAYQEITSISRQTIDEFLAKYSPALLAEPFPLPYEHLDTM